MSTLHKNCPACGNHILLPLFQSPNMPLSAMALPKSRREALNSEKYALDFVVCAECSHIYNRTFSYAEVPYSDSANLMYNKGSGWQDYINNVIGGFAKRHSLEGKTLLEIGGGDGHFLKSIMNLGVKARFVCFEPGYESDNAKAAGIEAYRDYFVPQRDLEKFKPDFIFCRHVLEHLENPREFIADIAHWVREYKLPTVFFAEVPRIDKAYKECRINDFLYYEHVSHFTEASFRNMFVKAGYEILKCYSAYADEVAIVEAVPSGKWQVASVENDVKQFSKQFAKLETGVKAKLEELKSQGKKIAFWGGAGRSAAFYNFFGLDHENFTLVVDSDPNKVGRFVPGTGQEISLSDDLITNPADVIIITTNWRARDIYSEIERKGIKFARIYILMDQELVEYHGQQI